MENERLLNSMFIVFAKKRVLPLPCRHIRGAKDYSFLDQPSEAKNKLTLLFQTLKWTGIPPVIRLAMPWLSCPIF